MLFWVFFDNLVAARAYLTCLGRGRAVCHEEDGWYAIAEGLSEDEANLAFRHFATRIMPVVPIPK